MTIEEANIINPVAEAFGLKEDIVDIELITSGHINDTYRVITSEGQYTMQKINRYVFKNPEHIMENIEKVTHYLRKKIKEDGGNSERETLRYLRDKDHKNYVILNKDNSFWRASVYIDQARTYNVVEDLSILESAGEAFGTFQRRLADFPAEQLHETIPHFHDTPVRLNDLFDAVALDPCGRVKDCMPEIKALEKQRDFCATVIDKQKQGLIPLRVTHNDTKFNNILIDTNTKKAVCVIDLDTVMPGISCYDFGDAIRFAANTTEEDETDLSKVTIDMAKYEAFTKGFMSSMNGLFTKDENDSMAATAIIDTLEIGCRFLEDYIRGDKYFKTHHEGQNLDRARNQIKLGYEMIDRLDEMDNIVKRYC